ncbi:hypothetical protein [Rhizobium leguminosarum]|uniref:hypothetical protein n=1 Tax=Rhizobium leguminosarum TaxID=384 RepID=UPI001C9390EB|nr:hypothetical protein [Rhizobium leguminosarum]MBY5826168.1 hypothetical protein [Rhizobium leguminosarum]
MNRDYFSAMTTFSKFYDIERIVGFFAFIPERRKTVIFATQKPFNAHEAIPPAPAIGFLHLAAHESCFPAPKQPTLPD